MRHSRLRKPAILYEHILTHRRIVALSLASSLVGVAWIVRDIVLVRVFGISAELDRFIAIVVVPTVIVTLVAGALATTVVPEYMRHRARSAMDAAAFHWRLSLAGMLLTMPIGILVTMALAKAGLMHLDWITADTQELFLYSMGVGLAAAAGVFGRLAAAVMNVHDRVFLQPALLSLPLIGPALTALAWPAAGTRTLFASFVIASLLQAAIATLSATREIPLRLSPSSDGSTLFERGFLSENLRLGLGTSLMSISEFVINLLAAAVGPGSLSQFSVSQRLPQLFQAFVGGVMASAAYPAVAKEFIGGNPRAGRALTLRLSLLAGAMGLVAAVAMGLASGFLGGLIVGQDSLAADREAIGGLLSLTAWQIPPAVAGIMLSRAIVSIGKSQILTYGALGYLCAVSAMGLAGVHFHSVAWAAGAPVIGYAISAGVAFAFVKRNVH